MFCSLETIQSEIDSLNRDQLLQYPFWAKYLLLLKKEHPMLEYLQVKVQNLVDEAKDIRKREQKARWQARATRGREKFALAERFTTVNQGLHLHRVYDVRKEARSSHLAYGFLRGLKYHEMEVLAYDQPDWNRIERLVEKYSEADIRDTKQKFGAWKAEALGRVKERYVKSHQPGSHRGRWTEWMHESRLRLSALSLPETAAYDAEPVVSEAAE
jgi:hypothetical protein